MNDCYINHVRLQEMLPFSSATNMSRGPTLPMLTGPSHKPIEYTTRNAASKPLFSNSVPPCTISTRNGKPFASRPCTAALRSGRALHDNQPFRAQLPLNTQIGGREPTHSALFPAIATAIRHTPETPSRSPYLEPYRSRYAQRIDPSRLDIENAAAAAALRMEVIIATEIIAVRRIGHGDAQNLPAFRQHAQVAIHGGAGHVG